MKHTSNSHSKIYIDSIKGILCILIMLGHYLGLIKYLNSPCILSESIHASFLKVQFSQLFFDEGCWLYFFLIISGFLLSKSSVSSLLDLIKRIMMRFIRLYLPIQFSCCIIYIMYSIIGLHNYDTKLLFENTWLQGSQPPSFTLLDIFLDPIRTILWGGSKFNSPYWMIRYVFYSSIIIYILSFVHKIISNSFIDFSTLILALLVAKYIHFCVFACVVGALLGYIIDSNIIFTKKYLRIATLSILTIISIVLCNRLLGVSCIIIFSVFLSIIERNVSLQHFFEHKPFFFLGKINFGIYSFHFPVLQSLGCYILLQLFPHGINADILLLIVYSCCIILTIIISIGYHLIFENWIIPSINTYLFFK